MKKRWITGLITLFFIFLSIWSYTDAHDEQVWWTEMSCAVIPALILAATHRYTQLSALAYGVFAVWCILQIIGAHYTFELVPIDSVSRALGFERNHYDRLAHFIVGINSVGVAELFRRKGWVTGPLVAAGVGILAIMAMANAWELVEWIYAEVDGGSAGAAFLGSQGDPWDAQKDMLMDSLGAVLGALLFLVHERTHPHRA